MSAPAGWYPDPSDSAARRWWNGTQWTAQTAPAPRFGEYAPAAPAAQASHAAPAVGGYAGYPAAPAYAGTGATPPVVDVSTNTVWVWLAVVAAVLPLLSGFFIDWNGYVSAVASMSRGSRMTGEFLSWEMRAVGVSLLSWVFVAAYIVFSWLDWRELKRRGVVSPFGWAWSFFALIGLGSAVYMIGRAVVLRRRTVSGGWAPLWTWAIASAVGLVASVWLAVWLFNEIMQSVSFGTIGS